MTAASCTVPQSCWHWVLAAVPTLRSRLGSGWSAASRATQRLRTRRPGVTLALRGCGGSTRPFCDSGARTEDPKTRRRSCLAPCGSRSPGAAAWLCRWRCPRPHRSLLPLPGHFTSAGPRGLGLSAPTPAGPGLAQFSLCPRRAQNHAPGGGGRSLAGAWTCQLGPVTLLWLTTEVCGPGRWAGHCVPASRWRRRRRWPDVQLRRWREGQRVRGGEVEFTSRGAVRPRASHLTSLSSHTCSLRRRPRVKWQHGARTPGDTNTQTPGPARPAPRVRDPEPATAPSGPGEQGHTGPASAGGQGPLEGRFLGAQRGQRSQARAHWWSGRGTAGRAQV